MEVAPEDRLDSWKEIAAYLRRDVTTVQRWEKREGMPVHRHVHDKLGSVYASRSELDGWMRSRNLAPEPSADDTIPETAPESTRADAGTRRPRWPRRAAWLLAGATFLLLAAIFWLRGYTEYFWRDPVAGAHFQRVTDFDGIEQAAAISRDGRFVAFQSDRDGPMDVWVTQLGTGRFYNLTRGRVPELVNASVRTLGFSPDGTLVTFWARRTDVTGGAKIGVWAIPVLGGDPQSYLDGVAEFDWSSDGSRLVYHTTGAGDPTFVKDNRVDSQASTQPIFTAAAGLHAHFPIWSADRAFIYFVQGDLPGAMDIWRIKASGGAPERITRHNAQVTHPVMVNARTLLYLATDSDGSGPWLYSVDVDTRIPHRISSGLDSYTSLAASADGRRLILTLARPKLTLWRMSVAETPGDATAAQPVALTTGHGFAPRLGPNYVLYVTSRDGSDTIWKLAEDTSTQLWTDRDAKIIGRPEVDGEGRRIAFSVDQHGKKVLYVMNADGTDARVVTASIDLRGSPAWTPDGRSLASAGIVNGSPNLFRISLDGTPAPLVKDYAIDPVWSPDGTFVVYSGPDIGTTFPLKAIAAGGASYALPNLTLTRGARRVRFFGQRRALVVMRGDIQHKDLWLIDLATGSGRQLTRLAPDFNIRDFDISKDGREVVLERMEEQSDLVLLTRSET